MKSSLIYIFSYLGLIIAFLIGIGNASDNCDAPIIPAPENGIDDQYIVVMKDGISDEEAVKVKESMENTGAKIRHQWRKGNVSEQRFQGFSVKVDGNKRSAVLRKAKKDCKVKYIEQDQMANATSCITQSNSGWCLSRIRNQNNQYPYPSKGGAGAAIYVIDSGCNPNHPDLKGRIKETRNFMSSEGNQDNNGHGTATASLVGGRSCGTAKSADLYCLKVLGRNGNGPYSDIIAAINWAASRSDKGILSLSLGGGFSSAVNDACDKAYRAGHLVVVAAGNENKDASSVSPASTASAITVGASDQNNNYAGFSNYGKFIDIVAPGVNCNSANLKNNGISQWTGTSMSTPLVAGICALIQVQNNWLRASDAPQKITSALINMARTNQLNMNRKPNTVNRLVFYNNCN